MKKIVLALLGAASTVPALAQTTPAVVTTPVLVPAPVAAPTAVLVAQPANVAFLRSGTPVAMKMAEALTTEKKKLRVGQRFMLEVAENVVVSGQTVIPIGSMATGEVTDVKNKGMWGKSGKINARVVSVRVGDRTIRMTGQLDDRGTAGTAGVVAAVVFVPVAGFFVTGTSARIPIGAPVKGFIDEDVQLAFAPTAPVAMTVPAAAPVVAAPVAAVTAVPAVAVTTKQK